MNKDLTVGKPSQVLWQFCLPMFGSIIFQQLYNIADSLVAGKFIGENALAAVGNSYEITLIFIAFAFGCNIGCSVIVSRYFGAKDYDEMKTSVYTSLIGSAVLCAVLMGIGLFGCDALLELINTPEEILADSALYLDIYVLGLPFMFFYNIATGIFSALGDSKTPLYFLILTSALNIGLDLLFIVPFKMGILGAALATDISQAISGVVSFGFLCRKFEVLHMQKGELAFSKRACTRLMGIGVPMGLQCSITAIGSVIMQWAVNVLGSTAVAAVTAASKTMNLLTVPLESVGTAMATYSGQNLGAARMDRVRKGVTSALLIATVYSIASALILHFADVAVMSLFLDTTTEVEIVAMGREYLFWNSVFFVPLGALIVWRYSIQGLGFSTLAMMAGVAEMIARTAVAIVLVPMLGYFGAELANPAAWIAACIFLYPAYRWTCRQLDSRLLAARLHIQSESPEHEAAL